MNQNTFKQKLETLASFPDVRTETVTAVGNVLEVLDSWELFRINPLRFAEEHKFVPSEILDLFVHGAKIGLFDFAWNMLCPSCGSIVDSHISLNEVEDNLFHCALCHISRQFQVSKRSCYGRAYSFDGAEIATMSLPVPHRDSVEPQQKGPR